jgi:hypothetical protein
MILHHVLVPSGCLDDDHMKYSFSKLSFKFFENEKAITKLDFKTKIYFQTICVVDQSD